MNRIERATLRYGKLEYRSKLLRKLYRNFSEAYMQGNRLQIQHALIAFEKGLELQKQANKGVRK
jgi:hypothetical protein